MRLALVILLSLATSGCALWRKDKEEPVETRTERERVEIREKPSDVMRPDSREIASPITDSFYVRGIYFSPTIATELRVDPTPPPIIIVGVPPDEGTLLTAEEDLGLDDKGDQARIEFDIRMAERSHMRIDYFKLNRYQEAALPRDIEFGNFSFDEGDVFRTKLDWRILSLTYSYSLLKFERFEAGVGLGLHVIEAHASGERPGTLERERADEVGIFPTLAVNAAFRLSKRFSVVLRGQTFSAEVDEFSGKLSDMHADIQFRAHKNLAIGVGYTQLQTHLEVTDSDLPLLFDMDASGPELFFRASF